jgi:hypothetical protein
LVAAARNIAHCAVDNPAGMFFHVDDHGRVVVASDPRSVVESVGGRWELDHEWLADWILGQASPAESPFRGLRRLLPGQSLQARVDGRVKVSDSSGPDVWAEPDLSGVEAEEAFREAFEVAIRRVATAEDVLTASLSGGLDSGYMVTRLAAHTYPVQRIVGFTAVPDPAAVMPELAAASTDEPEARLLAGLLGVNLRTVVSSHCGSPLQVASALSAEAWWPVFGPSNLPWVAKIRSQAADAGGAFLLAGAHGNASFSFHHGYAATRRRRLGRLRRRFRPSAAPEPSPYLAEAPSPRSRDPRRAYLTWLAGHDHPHYAFDNPAAFPIPIRDPFRDPDVIAVAARIRPEAWLRDGVTRGFARSVAAGVLPDTIRLRTLRGAQAPDIWAAMSGQRSDYLEQVDRLDDTLVLRDLIRIGDLRGTVTAWSWGTPEPPPLFETAHINRILAFGQFIRDSERRLAALN